MLISIHIIQFHRIVHLSIRTCVRFVIHSGGLWLSSHSLMDYRESVFPSIHHSDSIDPKNKFITMCYPLFLTQVSFWRLDFLLSHCHVQEHSSKTCRWLRWSILSDTFDEIQSFITLSAPSFLSNVFFVQCTNLYLIWRSIFVLTLRLLMSYIYGAPSKARNANVVYI